ncbi:hypothetical protein HMN09_00853800 [Mycena chlorophos]|uniref:Uncharacterized protein n=1 Tax=Mycena chlorophos TaxID=658473 RepID=A0A8H6SUB3_MYCCL|nr:hypothetical protein HMN09_00853800 [Mycena chlorophos]
MRTRSQRLTTAVLPVELWELALSQDFSVEELLVLATVSRVFHGLAIRVALRKSGLSSRVYTDEEINCPSLVLRILHLSFSTFAVCHLDVEFELANVHRDLRALEAIVPFCRSLKKLHIRFSGDILTSQEQTKTADLLVLMRILASLVAKPDGGAPVVVLFGTKMWQCQAKDVATWNLERKGAQFAAQMTPLTAQQLAQPRHYVDDESYWRRTEATVYNGASTYFQHLAELVSATVDCSLRWKNNPCSLITLNPPNATFFRLSQPSAEVDGGAILPAVLAQATLPHLSLIDIEFPLRAMPADISAFLLRHSEIDTLKVRTRALGRKPRDGDGDENCSEMAPLAHPTLTSLKITGFLRDPVDPSPLQHLVQSPNLRNLAYNMPAWLGDAPVDAFADELGIMASIPGPVSLKLSLARHYFRRRDHDRDGWESDGDGDDTTADGSQSQFWYQHPRVTAVLPTLHCVQELEVTINSRSEGHRLLEFVRLLPGVVELRFLIHPDERLRLRSAEEGDAVKAEAMRARMQEWERRAEEFAEWAREQLPGVATLTAQLWC